MKRKFDVMEACAASALDFIDTLIFCLKEQGEASDDDIEDTRNVLLSAHEMHYNTDAGEQGEHIEKYLNKLRGE